MDIGKNYVFAALMFSSPAAAAVTFDFTSGSNSAVDGSVGNTVMRSNGTLNVTASAWWYNPSYASGAPQSAYLGQYTHGLGVTDHNAAVNSENGSNNTHTIDNAGNYDFIVLVFNQAVNIQSGVLYPFAVNGSTDNDAWISVGTGAAFNSAFFTNTLLNNDYDVAGVGSPTYSVPFSPLAGQYGNIWLIGAAGPGAGSTDFNTDGFKLSSIVVNAAVPEPATWAMMLLGFGAIGFAMRRAGRQQPSATIA